MKLAVIGITSLIFASLQIKAQSVAPLTPPAANVQEDSGLNPLTISSADSATTLPRTKWPLKLTTYMEFPSLNVLLATDQGEGDLNLVGERVQYNPVAGPNFGITGELFGFKLSWAKKMTFLSPKDQQVFGHNPSEDWKATYHFTDHVEVDVYYQNYKGFTADLNGASGLQTTVSRGNQGNSEPQPGQPSRRPDIINRPDIQAKNLGGRVRLVQKFGAGEETSSENLNFGNSFLPGWMSLKILSYGYYNSGEMQGKENLVPSQRAEALSSISNLRSISTDTFGLGVGFGLGAAFTSKWKLDLEGTFGGGLQNRNLKFVDKPESDFGFGQEVTMKIDIARRGVLHDFEAGLNLALSRAKARSIAVHSTAVAAVFAYTYKGIGL